MIPLVDIETLFARKGAEQYSGESVTQLEHALQCAFLAEQSGADDEIITAALLHDLGHMLHDLNSEFGPSPTVHGVDDVHQYIALPFLRGLFSNKVLSAIQLHVDAKRYLCAMRPEYFTSLSADSVRSLKLQGGIFSETEAKVFIGQLGAEDAIRVRIWDDLAKVHGLKTPTLRHYLNIAERCKVNVSIE
jgi:phosphonate degradation associated HDIG domain protein